MNPQLNRVAAIAFAVLLGTSFCYSQCTVGDGCTIIISADESSNTNVSGTDILCIDASGGNVTVSGDINMSTNSTMRTCSGSSTDTVIISGAINSGGGGPSSQIYVENHGNLTIDRTPFVWTGKFNFDNYGYNKYTGDMTAQGHTFNNHAGGEVEVLGNFTVSDGVVISDDVMTVHGTASFSGGTFTSNAPMDIYSYANVNNGVTVNFYDDLHVYDYFNIQGILNTDAVITVDSLLTINSAGTLDLSGGVFIVLDLTINDGDITSGTGGNCTGFVVSRTSTVFGGPTFTGTVHIQDSTLAVGDSVDVNSGCGVCNFTAGSDGGGCITLPVELLEFDGHNEGEINLLHWVTATEINNDYFTLFKSTDGVEFEEIGEINGAGNSNAVLYYEYPDDHPNIGTNYYQLKQTDYDGTSSMSNIVEITLKDLEIISMYPNPANDHIAIAVISAEARSIQTEVIDVLGRTIISKSLDIEGGITTISFDDLQVASGKYFVRIIDAETGYSTNGTIQINAE